MRTGVTPAASCSTGAHRVTYWTGIWEPRREAISKEVAWLRGALAPGSPVVAFTPQPSGMSAAARVLRINFNRWYTLRAAAALLERSGALTHVFGGVGTSDHFLYLLGRRPLLFTVVIPGAPSGPAMYAKVRHFVAESQGLASTLLAAGVERSRIEIIYPAVDTSAYVPRTQPPAEPFTVLFASSPADPSEIDARGIGLLIEVARLRPDVQFIVLWRQWGDVAGARRAVDSRHPPDNFHIEHRDAVEMTEVYQQVHATVCLFDSSVGKSAPNSVIEGLATGRPALVSDTCGLSDVLAHWRAGVVTPRTLHGVAQGLDELRSHYGSMSQQARRLSEAEFDSRRALTRYATIYERLMRRPSS